ncbi:MAG TPA: hypothetical protein VHP30_07445 [Ignavibacteriales bacterium]|nr:hypothetical protein [Ignavibacteriales bacterium]
MKSFSASSLFTLFIIAAALIFFRGCSASSYSSRTDKSNTEKKSASKDVRFTDEDDGSPEKTDADPAPHSPRIEEEFEEMEIGTIERDQEIKAEYIKKNISPHLHPASCARATWATPKRAIKCLWKS